MEQPFAWTVVCWRAREGRACCIKQLQLAQFSGSTRFSQEVTGALHFSVMNSHARHTVLGLEAFQWTAIALCFLLILVGVLDTRTWSWAWRCCGTRDVGTIAQALFSIAYFVFLLLYWGERTLSTAACYIMAHCEIWGGGAWFFFFFKHFMFRSWPNSDHNLFYFRKFLPGIWSKEAYSCENISPRVLLIHFFSIAFFHDNVLSFTSFLYDRCFKDAHLVITS